MLIDLFFNFIWVYGFFLLVGALAWLADKLISFHLEGLARVRRLQEKEREGAR